MKRLCRSLWRIASGLVLLFLTAVLVQALLRTPLTLDRHRIVLPAAAGFGGGILVFTLGSRFLLLYVFGHELTHWLMAKLFRRRTGRFRVGAGHGSVAVERPNIWIALAPYFIPVYALGCIGLYGVVKHIMQPAPPDAVVKMFMAAIGAAYAFHVRLTAFAASRAQSDFAPYGRFLSLSLVLCCNAALLFVALVAAGRAWHHGLLAFTRSFNGSVDTAMEAARWFFGVTVGQWITRVRP